MRILNELRQEIKKEDVDLEKCRVYVARIIRPDAVPVDNITKFAWDDEDYEEVQIFEYIPEEIRNRKRIEKLKQNLSSTDYVIIKIMEGKATLDEYADVIANRDKWREEINLLESK